MPRQQLIKNLLAGILLVIITAVSGTASAVSIKAGNTNVSIYGFAKLDMMYDIGDIKAGKEGLGNSLQIGNIGVGDQPTTSGGHTTIHAYESRIGFKTSTPTKSGNLNTLIEGDFYGGGGGQFRLRRAFGSWNGILAGQEWTNFGSLVYATPTLDFTGPLARAGMNRQAQIRYSIDKFHIALEAPHGDASGTAFSGQSDEDEGGIVGVDDDDRKNNLPDMTARYESSLGKFNYAAGAVLRQVGFDDGENDDSANGWGLFAGGNIELRPGTTIRGAISGGDGIGGYMNGAPMPAAYRIGNDIQTIPAWGGLVGFSQRAGIGKINFVYSYAKADWDDAESDGLVMASAKDKERQLMYLNYIWSPIEHVTYGIEIGRAERKTASNDKGDATRVHASVIYSF